MLKILVNVIYYIQLPVLMSKIKDACNHKFYVVNKGPRKREGEDESYGEEEREGYFPVRACCIHTYHFCEIEMF